MTEHMTNLQQIIKGERAVFFIAEIGKNFIQTKEEQSREQYLKNAKELILKAKEAGADAVKFQTHNVEDEQIDLRVVSPHFSGADRYSWVKRNNEITTREFWQEIKSYCQEQGVTFFSTPMSRGAAMLLEGIGVPFWKVGSADILDFVMLDYLAGTGKPIILASGMSSLEEIDRSVEFLKKRGSPLILLYCVSKYPCPPEDLRLGTINFFQKRYNIPVGFSDHSLGIEAAIAAAGLGAVVIEKHFSLSRNLWGSDHKVSITPEEYAQMVETIRKGVPARASVEEPEKFLTDDELALRPIFRKALVAGADLKAGDILTKENIYAMRPQAYIDGLPSEDYERVLGKKLTKDLKKYCPLTGDILD